MLSRMLLLLLTLCFASSVSAEDVPWLNEVNTPPQSLGAAADKASADGASGKQLREQIRTKWNDFLGAYRFADLPLQLETLKEEQLADCTRLLIRYQAEPGRMVRAYLLIPNKTTGKPLPAIVAFHGTSATTFDKLVGLDGEPERHMGLRLAKRGFIVICPENFLWEQKSYTASTEAALKPHPGSKGMAVMLADGMRAVDVLLSRKDVDAKRIGAYGHSLGAKETLYLTAFDDRIRAAVASEGGIEIGFSNWDAIWYLSDVVHAKDFSLTHHDLLRLIAGRPFLVLGGESGRGCADGERSWPTLLAGHEIWQTHYQTPIRLGLLNHGQGHSLPWEAGEKTIEWLEVYVGGHPARE
ncbi:MAG: sialidase [Planctomyces sp.]|nr:sialidase [Planctomyces sp.]